MSLDGKPIVPSLGSLDDREVGVFSIVQYPNFWLDVNPDYAWIMRLTLIHTRRVDVEAIWMVREDAREGINYDPRRLEEFWGEH
jgi:Rieske 2Fe-2S family protein